MAYKRNSPIPVVEGGTGAKTLTGVLIGNGTSAVTGNAVTQYDVLVGGASNAVSSVGPGTSGQVLQSGGNAANPAYSTATYPATTTINQLLYSSAANTVGGVTAGNYGVLISSSAGVPSWLANGTTGQVLTATTSGTPSWAAAASGGITTIDGNSGSVTGSTVTFQTTGTNITFAGSSATMTLAMGGGSSSNILIGTTGTISSGQNNSTLGYNCGAKITTGSNNLALGYEVMSSNSVTGSNNIGLGNTALQAITSDSYSVCIGNASGRALNGSLQNTFLGNSTAYNMTTGSYNTILGANTGTSYSGSESSNVIIGYNTVGTAAESHVLRIGVATGTSNGYLNSAYICGIRGITSASSDQLLAVNSSNQIASIGAGTAGQVLVSNGAGSAPSFQTASSVGAWVLLNTQTASSSASLSFTSTYITSTYKVYMIVLQGIIPATGSVNASLNWSTDNGSTFINTNLAAGVNQMVYNSATLLNTNSTTNNYIAISASSTFGINGTIYLYNMAGTGNSVPTMTSSISEGNQNVFGTSYLSTGTANVNNVQLIFGSGNIASGTMSLYGLAQ